MYAKNVTKCSKMSTFWNFGDYIHNHHEKCIEISTTMPNIGLEIPDITFEICKKVKTILHG